MKRVWEEFGIKNLGEYYYLYVQSNKLLLDNVFENFRNKYRKIYGLEPINFLSALELECKAALIKIKLKL